MPFPQYKVIELSTLSIPSEKLTLLAAMTEIFLFLSFLIAFIFKSSVSAANPIEKTLRKELGSKTAIISESLEKFKHPFSNRKIDWDISNSLWVEEHLKKFEVNKREILKNFIKDFLISFKDLDILNDNGLLDDFIFTQIKNSLFEFSNEIKNSFYFDNKYVRKDVNKIIL